MAASNGRIWLVESVLPPGLRACGIAARVDAAWLQLTARPSRELAGVNGDPWPWLGCNAGMDGSIRLALAPGSRMPHLRADLPIEVGSDEELEDRVASLCQSFIRWSEAPAEKTLLGKPFPIANTANASSDPTRVAELCFEAGWPCATRTTGDPVVTLSAGAVSYSARLEPTRNDAVSFVVDLFDASACSPDSRTATALLLLSASAAVRSVKAIVRPTGDGEIGALAAACASTTSAAALDLALSSLAVACEIVGREAQALADDGLARDCLAWWGWDRTSPPPVADAFDEDPPSRKALRRDKLMHIVN